MVEHDLNAVAFPKLDEAQMEMLGRCGGATLKRYADGRKLIEVGERDFKFFVVREGEIEILDESGERPKTIAVLGRGEFTGDVSHLTGGPSLVSAIARGDCEVYEVAAEGVREIINRFPDLGDRILQAFVARRQLLREPHSSQDRRGQSFFSGELLVLPVALIPLAFRGHGLGLASHVLRERTAHVLHLFEPALLVAPHVPLVFAGVYQLALARSFFIRHGLLLLDC
jgi:CRP-like cAMP-binding protein